ncbi:palmitoyltransferase Erf2p [Diutina catenulata]
MTESVCKRTVSTGWETVSRSSDIAEPAQIPRPRRPWVWWFITNWLVTDPALYEEYHGAAKKAYQHQPQYIYWMGGRWRSAKQRPINVACVVFMVVPAVLYAIFEASWLWHHVSPAVVIVFCYLWLLMFALFMRASTSDPGVLPRHLHYPRLDEPEPEEYENTIRFPAADGRGVNVKFCPTCKIWRPPRTSHCHTCDVCVIKHDHHCIFLNNCVGHRNYRYFLYFLAAAVAASAFLVATSFVRLSRHRPWAQAIRQHPMALVLAVYALIGSVYPLLLLLFHVFLTAHNLTTREYLNYVRGDHDPEFANVYDTGNVATNWYLNWLGYARGPSVASSTKPLDNSLSSQR